jgi:NADPH2:quinone reductase
MRALVARRLDGPELIETAVPEPAAGQVRIKVAAAAVNPVDLAVSTGVAVQSGLTQARDQFGLGWDVAGSIDATGPDVDLTPGTAVVALADLLGRPLKTHAEYVVLDAEAIAPAPNGVDPVAASTYGLNALTALQALRALDNPKSVLITGAAGGVGGYAVELAKHLGLTVIASADKQDEELVRRLGADHFIDRTADLATEVRRIAPAGMDGLVDAAIVGIGAQEAVRHRGHHAHLEGGPKPPHLRGITVHQIFIQTSHDDLTELTKLIEAGIISTRVAGTYPLEDADAAYKRLTQGRIRGRLVLVP